MLNSSNRRRIIISIVISLFIAFAFLAGCKQKEQPFETKQPPPSEKSEQVAQSQLKTSEVILENKDLRILYTGHPGSNREKDFVGFLRKHFKTVETGDFKTFKNSDAEGFDVTILDYDGDSFKAPRPSITDTFVKPVVTVGVVGAFMGMTAWMSKK